MSNRARPSDDMHPTTTTLSDEEEWAPLTKMAATAADETGCTVFGTSTCLCKNTIKFVLVPTMVRFYATDSTKRNTFLIGLHGDSTARGHLR